MKKKIYRSALVIIPPIDFWPPIQAIRKSNDRQFFRWMPHVNLMYPFLTREEYLTIRSKLLDECKKIKSFEITLNQFKYFSHGHQNYTIWLNTDPPTPILNLQKKLLKIVPECDDLNRFKGGFKPHLSVGQVKGKKKLITLLLKLQESWQPLTFLVKSIYFIQRKPEKSSKFEISEEIPLLSLEKI
ncbi:MAG: 2'-5' RNA ligase family protein [Promethearchaeota archaeon]